MMGLVTNSEYMIYLLGAACCVAIAGIAWLVMWIKGR